LQKENPRVKTWAYDVLEGKSFVSFFNRDLVGRRGGRLYVVKGFCHRLFMRVRPEPFSVFVLYKRYESAHEPRMRFVADAGPLA